jgi:hypothetical protein
MYDIVHGSQFTVRGSNRPRSWAGRGQELADGGSNRPRARKKRPAKLLAYPHVTNEKLLRFRRGWIFLLVTRIL